MKKTTTSGRRERQKGKESKGIGPKTIPENSVEASTALPEFLPVKSARFSGKIHNFIGKDPRASKAAFPEARMKRMPARGKGSGKAMPFPHFFRPCRLKKGEKLIFVKNRGNRFYGNTMPSDIKRMKRKKKIDDEYGTQLHAIYYSVFAIAYKWKKKQYE